MRRVVVAACAGPIKHTESNGSVHNGRVAVRCDAMRLLRCVAASCGMLRRFYRTPQDVAPHRNETHRTASGVNKPLESVGG